MAEAKKGSGSTKKKPAASGKKKVKTEEFHATSENLADQLKKIFKEGNVRRVHRATNAGSAWRKLADLPITQAYRTALDASNPDARYLGAQDNGTNRTLTGSTDDWTSVFGGDGFQPLVHPTNSNSIWAQYQYGTLVHSHNGGGSWSGATGGISGPDVHT